MTDPWNIPDAPPTTNDRWRDCWRRGFAPLLPTAGLEALANALREDSAALVQSSTTEPPPLQCYAHSPVCGACAVAYALWIGNGLTSVEEVEDAFARATYDCDTLLGQPGGCREFLNAYDSWTRDTMRSLLLPEVELALSLRQ